LCNSAAVSAIVLIGLALAASGEIGVIAGDPTTVKAIDGAWGLEEEQLRAVVARYAADVADAPAVLVLFTAFDDIGLGSAGYFVPIFNDTPGTGMGPIDRRAEFGTARIEGVVNLKSIDQELTEPRLHLAAHEIAHRHAAYLEVATSTVISILGRQGSHWHAALESGASLLDGYSWRDLGGGQFRVEAKSARLGPLDLYALGMLPADEVGPFFFIDDARVESGARLPPGAQLAIGASVHGTRLDLDIDDVIAVLGPRPPAAPRLRLLFALVTAPGSTADAAEIDRIDAFRRELEAAWPSLTREGFALCTQLDGCPEPEPVIPSSCASTRASGDPWALVLLALVYLNRRHLVPYRTVS